jgi:hypothetical protein
MMARFFDVELAAAADLISEVNNYGDTYRNLANVLIFLFCHAFAGAFLLLRDAIEKALMPARRKISLWELKESYGISLRSAPRRWPAFPQQSS